MVRGSSSSRLEVLFLWNRDGPEQGTFLADLELNQDDWSRSLGSEESAGHRTFTPHVEEVPEPEGSGLAGVEPIDLEHVPSVHPDIEVDE